MLKISNFLLLLLLPATLSRVHGLSDDPEAVVVENGVNQQNEKVEVYRDNSTVVRFDKNLDKNRTQWLFTLFSSTWKFVRENYGYFGGGSEEGRLFGEFRVEGKGRRSFRQWSWANYDDKNRIEGRLEEDSQKTGGFYDDPASSGSSKVKWPKDKYLVTELLLLIADMVLNGNNRVGNSITDFVVESGAWGDIFVFDLLTQLGHSREAEEWRSNKVKRNVRTKTVKGDKVFWMRDWSLPLYEKFGKTRLFAKFFELTATYWTKEYNIYKEDPTYKYDERMEVGAYVHFMSGAAGKDLRSMAKTAFGWNQTNDAEFTKARQDYPQLKYSA